MPNAITCPSCQTEIEISEVMRSQLTEQIRTELEADAALKRAELDAAKKQLEQERSTVEASRQSIDEQIHTGIAVQREKLVAEANKRARNSSRDKWLCTTVIWFAGTSKPSPQVSEDITARETSDTGSSEVAMMCTWGPFSSSSMTRADTTAVSEARSTSTR